MSYLSYSAYIFNLWYIASFEWKSSELIKCLPITSPGFAGSKSPGGFMVRSIKGVPGTSRDLKVNSKLSPWNGWTGLRHLNSVHWKRLQSSFLEREELCYVSAKPDIYLFSIHCLQLLFFLEGVYQRKKVERNLAKWIRFWVGHCHQL